MPHSTEISVSVFGKLPTPEDLNYHKELSH